MGAKPGAKPGTPRHPNSGRRKGSRNLVSLTLKDAILKSFNEVGGWEYLAEVARTDHRTYCALLARVLPAEVQAQLKSDANFTIQVVNYSSTDEHTNTISVAAERLPDATMDGSRAGLQESGGSLAPTSWERLTFAQLDG